ncbi:MAG TPA: phosphoribosylaminoimidazolesuccinocarboxamide synthase [Fimbriimonas sp.]|nr:phosphoribosylaminoimidazolesuccinocarboxamide synthase [Fimbriimonas sp.]
MSGVLLQSSVRGLPAPRRGKVRDVYDLGDQVLIVATDRLSAFDVVMDQGIPGKGQILTQLSAFWFRHLQGVCPNHVLTTDDGMIASAIGVISPGLRGRATLATKAKTIPIECVARGYITGSLYKEYLQQGSFVHGLELPVGLVDSDKLPEPIFTPATKADQGHDENTSFRAVVDQVGYTTAHLLRDWTLELFAEASKHAASKGLILADTKFEFGETEDGIILIDEALTPDSSRYWDVATYEPGKSQPSYDKQFVRDYLETTDWDKTPPPPALPEEVILGTRAKYIEAFVKLTDRQPNLS